MVVASISGSVDRAFTVFFAWVPALVGAIVVLLIGNVVAKVAPRPSRLLGTVVFWAILLSAISLAASVLHIKALTAFVGAVWAYLPNVIAALAIFIIAGLVATAVATFAKRVMGDTGLGRVVAAGVPILVMTIATFMILNQLKIAPAIVTITYAALLGAIALGSALAFGLGGREVAARMLEGAYGNVQENKQQWKHDLETGKERAKDEARTKVNSSQNDHDHKGEAGRYTVTGTPATDLNR